MSLAESAILLDLHSVRMSLLILGSIVITLLAFGACQSDFRTHFLTSTYLSSYKFLVKKKELKFFSLDYYITCPAVSSIIFFVFYFSH